MHAKVQGLIKDLAGLAEQIGNSYTKGLVDGFDRPSMPQSKFRNSSKHINMFCDSGR